MDSNPGSILSQQQQPTISTTTPVVDDVGPSLPSHLSNYLQKQQQLQQQHVGNGDMNAVVADKTVDVKNTSAVRSAAGKVWVDESLEG